MKVPRDVNASDLINILGRHGYSVIRQTGSHIRLSKKLDKGEHIVFSKPRVGGHSPFTTTMRRM